MPRDVILALGLSYRGETTWKLATGQEVTIANYDGMVSWHGQSHNVVVIETSSGSLLGMALLLGSRVAFDAQIGGEVVIEEDLREQ